MGWFESVEHNRWLSTQMRALLDEAQGAVVPTGFAHMTPDGQADLERPIDLAVTARMTYIYSLGTLMGLPGSRRWADHGVRALSKSFSDSDQASWHTYIEAEPDEEGCGIPAGDNGAWKSQFHLAFLILGAAAATVANRPGAHELLAAALHDQERHWIDERGLVYEVWSPDYSETMPQRSMVCLLHTAEAYLAAAEATTDPLWIERAEVMAKFVHDTALAHNWRVPEYYDGEWRPLRSEPVPLPNERRLYKGSVIGHEMQWSRLALHIRAALRSMGRPQPDYLLDMSRELFERARVDSWRRNGKPGFAFSVSADGEPLDTDHMQWVACEGVCAAVALRRALLDDGAEHGEVEHYEHSYRSWIDFLNDYMIERPGKWRRALDEDNVPIVPPPVSRADVYHSVQTMLISRVPLWPPFASAISRDLLDHPEEPPADRKSWNIFHRR